MMKSAVLSKKEKAIISAVSAALVAVLVVIAILFAGHLGDKARLEELYEYRDEILEKIGRAHV